MKRIFILVLLARWMMVETVLGAQIFLLPTANRALFEPGREEAFFVGTTGKPWTSGMFGCVRSEGRQMHEGLDIKCLQRDAHGEPMDPVMATADGAVAYLNGKAALSNYGKYLILKHRVEGLEVFSTYAHLSEIRRDLTVGAVVKAGETIATMGRTSNTREAISKERAHVHFEIDLFVNERFPAWYQRNFPGQRNDHGAWNGQNLLGLDPRQIFLEQEKEGNNFSLLHFIRHQTELCRVQVRKTHFPWLKRYTPLILRNPLADQEGVNAYEIALNYNGVPFRLVPRSSSEMKGAQGVRLLSVNEAECAKHPCRHLVLKRGDHWELGNAGRKLIDLLTN